MTDIVRSDGLHSYDRLRDINPAKEFSFTCYNCKSLNIHITPVNISYRIPTGENLDNRDLPLEVRSMYNKLPFIQKACIMANESNEAHLMYECKDCHSYNTIYDKCNRLQLRRYLHKAYGSEPMIVGDIIIRD